MLEVIKKINNNFAICLDSNGTELIAFGTGIGFPKTPYILNDLSNVKRTYYGVNNQYIHLLNELSEEIFVLTEKIVEMAQIEISSEIPSVSIFALADHISFAVERYKKKIQIKMPVYYDFKQFYKKELEVSTKAIALINAQLNVFLPKEEAIGIAMHFINSINNTDADKAYVFDERFIIKKLTEIIEQNFNLSINHDGMNYARFVSHIQYLLKRREGNALIQSDNNRVFTSIKIEYPKAHQCAIKMKYFLESTIHWRVSDEELLYLILHINRLCAREDSK